MLTMSFLQDFKEFSNSIKTNTEGQKNNFHELKHLKSYVMSPHCTFYTVPESGD